MLKLMPPSINFNAKPKTKCGEVFCHNTTEFTIYCTFCEMKSFNFEDFLLHLKSLHFAQDVPETEINNCVTNSIKLETEEDIIYDSLIKSYVQDSDRAADDDRDFCDNDDSNFSDNSYDEKPLAILKQKKVKSITKRRKIQDRKSLKSDDSNEDDFQDFDSDEEFRPKLSSETHTCSQCEESFKSLSQLKSHLNRIHEDKWSETSSKKEKQGKQIACNECDQIFPYKKSLYSHIVDYHMGFKCSMCDKRFKQLQQRDRHEFCHTAKRIFSCEIEGCNKSFTHKYYLQRHIDSHNKDRKFVCDFDKCNKAFHTLRCLKAHKNRHIKPKNLICDTCGYTCREYDRLRIHQRVHTGEKPYGCQDCGKRFTSNAALLEHTVSHTGVKSHVCSNCSATFTRQKSLYQHRQKCLSTPVTPENECK